MTMVKVEVEVATDSVTAAAAVVEKMEVEKLASEASVVALTVVVVEEGLIPRLRQRYR